MVSANADALGTPIARLAPAGLHASNADRLAEIVGKASTGIDSLTGLASDFLNQFNEVSMLLDMASDDVELLEELEGWSPRGYVAHFEASNFRDSELVLEAYALCPEDTRQRFDLLANELGQVITTGLEEIATLGDDEAAVVLASQTLATEVRGRIDTLSAIIHPAQMAPSNTDISALFAARR